MEKDERHETGEESHTLGAWSATVTCLTLLAAILFITSMTISPSSFSFPIPFTSLSLPQITILTLHKRATTPTPPPHPPSPILISSDLPTFPTSSPFAALWSETISSLSTLSKELATKEAPYTIRGIPGTGIETDEEAELLQKELDNLMGKGEWRWDRAASTTKEGEKRTGLTVHKQEGIYASCDKSFYKHSPTSSDDATQWNVRQSLQYLWRPSHPLPSSSSLTRKSLCQLLAHKSILLIGDTTQFSLHDLILDWTTMSPQTCYGDLYCKEHRICGEIIDEDITEEEDGEEKEWKRVEDWEGDERVFERLPPTPPKDDHHHPKRPPLQQRDLPLDKSTSHLHSRQSKSNSPTSSTLLRYRRSDGLRIAPSSTKPEYRNAYSDIREMNQQWLADSRRSDLVILNKGPFGLSERYLERVAGEEDGKEEEEEEEEVRRERDETKVMELIKEVRESMREHWLPDLMETLKAIRATPSPKDQLIVYRGTWRSHSDCGRSNVGLINVNVDGGEEFVWSSPGDGPPPYSSQPTLQQLLYSGPPSPTTQLNTLTNPHTLLFNFQTILQNHLLRTFILPSFGIPYLDLESPSSIFRTSMIGSSLVPPFSHSLSSSQQQPLNINNIGVGLRNSQSGDCNRYCLPSPGMVLEEAFLGGLGVIMERGWRGGRREKVWMGEGFRSLKERLRDRVEVGESEES